MSGLDAETEERRAQLANACRLLEKVGEKNPLARSMVQRLVDVLRKHRVHGVETDRTELIASAHQGARMAGDVQSRAMASATQDWQHAGQQEILPEPPVNLNQQQQADAGGWANSAVDANPVPLTGIWNDFLGTNPSTDGWSQLFSDLDYIGGGM